MSPTINSMVLLVALLAGGCGQAMSEKPTAPKPSAIAVTDQQEQVLQSLVRSLAGRERTYLNVEPNNIRLDLATGDAYQKIQVRVVTPMQPSFDIKTTEMKGATHKAVLRFQVQTREGEKETSQAAAEASELPDWSTGVEEEKVSYVYWIDDQWVPHTALKETFPWGGQVGDVVDQGARNQSGALISPGKFWDKILDQNY